MHGIPLDAQSDLAATTGPPDADELRVLRQRLVVRCGGLGVMSAAVATVHGAPVLFRVLPVLICAVPPALAWMAECEARGRRTLSTSTTPPRKVVKSS